MAFAVAEGVAEDYASLEKQARSVKTYDVAVAMEDGSSRVINVSELGGLSAGARVRVEGNNIYLR